MMNVYDTANRLAGEIKESEEYVNYKMARQALALNPDLKKKIGDFEVARSDAQLTQMQTGKEDEEKTNKKKVYELSKKGQQISEPTDILKDPYVFEFLGIKEEKPSLESDLEKRLVNHISEFLMELGKGFMYVGKQVRITLDNNTHYYVDLVFYNKILRSYVLIDLKMTDMKPEYVGQMNMYINYYNNEVRDDFDNETIGIILCKGKKDITLEYALGGMNNNIFASNYTYYMPNKEELIDEVERALKEVNN